jgi:hypothetical protein
MKCIIAAYIVSLALGPIGVSASDCQTTCQNQISTCATSASEQRQRLLSEGDRWADKEMWREAVEHFGSMTPEKCAVANQSCPVKCEAKLAKKNKEKKDKDDLVKAVQSLDKIGFEKLKAELAAIEKQIEESHRNPGKKLK